ncbi:hypothetical protein PMAYCL1PPCAC_01375, partial [Pristionchus mayeri]
SKETRERLAKMFQGVQDMGKCALETEIRGTVFDCSDEMRRVASELEKELGNTWRKLNAKEYVCTVP